jgi:hypothetical protein
MSFEPKILQQKVIFKTAFSWAKQGFLKYVYGVKDEDQKQ